nr:immunoglobulin heavy chain junction region [Mus musculus]
CARHEDYSNYFDYW